MKEGGFELLPAEEMRRKYGLVAANRQDIALDPSLVPADLRHLIPLAELWGVGDDLIREDLLARAPRAAVEDLKRIVAENEDRLEAWLAGPAAAGPKFSREYTAFTAMLMAADCG